MDEAKWLTSDDPEAMCEAVQDAFRTEYPHGMRTARKRSFFGAACCRLVWPLVLMDDRCRRKVEYIERQFDEDQTIPEEEVDAIWQGMHDAYRHPEAGVPELQSHATIVVDHAEVPIEAIRCLLRLFDGWGDPKERARQIADIMRCIIGNPFRPITFDPNWRTSTVVVLAEGIYADRAFDRLPILADALEDAGCDHPDILAHCRGPGPHVRGCWVVDLVLGKS